MQCLHNPTLSKETISLIAENHANWVIKNKNEWLQNRNKTQKKPPTIRTCGYGNCGLKTDRWICLTCGDVFCGRMHKTHTSAHSLETTHNFYMNVVDQKLYCYSCDEYILSIPGCEEEVTEFSSYVLETFKKKKKTPMNLSFKSGISTREVENLIEQYTMPSCSRQESKRTGTRQKYDTVTGLANLGNTCFMNSVLQAFCHTPIIQAQYFKNVSNLSNVYENSICEELKLLLIEMWTTTSTMVSPRPFLEAVRKFVPSFQGNHQQDAQEFIRYLLDQLNSEKCPDAASISKLFSGYLVNEVKCLKCNYSSVRNDSFMDLSLSIPENSIHRPTRRHDDSPTLEDCLKSLIDEEILGETDLYDCPGCFSKQRCTKKLSIGGLPEILCLHIKRFKYSNNDRSKIDTYIRFPVEGLDMAPYFLQKTSAKAGSKEPLLYDLYSCITHNGNASSGHFVSYSWNPQQRQWFQINDSAATPTTLEFVTNINVYMLFFVKRGADASSYQQQQQNLFQQQLQKIPSLRIKVSPPSSLSSSSASSTSSSLTTSPSIHSASSTLTSTSELVPPFGNNLVTSSEETITEEEEDDNLPITEYMRKKNIRPAKNSSIFKQPSHHQQQKQNIGAFVEIPVLPNVYPSSSSSFSTITSMVSKSNEDANSSRLHITPLASDILEFTMNFKQKQQYASSLSNKILQTSSSSLVQLPQLKKARKRAFVSEEEESDDESVDGNDRGGASSCGEIDIELMGSPPKKKK